MDNRSLKIRSRDVAEYERSSTPIKLRRKIYKSLINKQRRTLEKEGLRRQVRSLL